MNGEECNGVKVENTVYFGLNALPPNLNLKLSFRTSQWGNEDVQIWVETKLKVIPVFVALKALKALHLTYK